MGQRLQPLSSAWLAPHALAAQLTARAGEATGQGLAALGAGIGGGLAQIGENRKVERARQDRLTQQTFSNDLATKQYEEGVRQDNFQMLGRYAEGLQAKLQMAMLADPTGAAAAPLKQELEQATSSLKHILSQSPALKQAACKGPT